jgi:glucans biosynthesis protein
VTQTRRGRGYVRNDDGTIGFTIDFEGPALKKLPADASVEVLASGDANAEVREAIAHRNDVTGGWRVVLRIFRSDANKPAELRAYLRSRTSALSETWSYILPAD